MTDFEKWAKQKKKATYQDVINAPALMVAQAIDRALTRSHGPRSYRLAATHSENEAVRAEPFDAIVSSLAFFGSGKIL